MSRKKAVVAMSGGVDSSVAAALLVEAGYDVTGIMLKLWSGEAANNDSGCCNLNAAEDARRVADALDIRFYVLNFAERFERTVIADFHADYAAGRTPNPCVRCNQWVKFGELMRRADALEADVLATGHYAQSVYRAGRYRLLRGKDPRKDQSYVLWMLKQEELARCLFPVGGLDKSETRAIATELGLRTAAKAESQEICFVKGGDFDSYVGEHMPEAAAPGEIVDGAGNVLGRHRGIGRYTVGQRKGLGVSLGAPVFVTSIDARSNQVVVGDRSDLAVGGLVAHESSFTAEPPAEGTRVLVQHRAHGEVAEGRVGRTTVDRFEIGFIRPVEAVAPGQSVAIYELDNQELIGGGTITQTLPALVARREDSPSVTAVV